MQRGSFVSLLNYCFPLVRINGYNVKCHWTIIFFLFIYIHYFTVEMSLRMGPGMALLLAVLSTLMLYTIVLIHEMGHGAAGRRLGHRVDEIYLHPLGGMVLVTPRSPREELIITFWGPAVHPLLLVLATPLYLLVKNGLWQPSEFTYFLVHQFFWLNVILLVFNLLPAFPMDGGRLLRAWLAQRMYAAKATVIACYVGQVVSILFIVYAVARWDGFFSWFLILIAAQNLMACEQHKYLAREVDPYQGDGWGPDGASYDLSNYYSDESGVRYGGSARRKRKGIFARWAERRRRKAEQRARRAREAQIQREKKIRVRVDELLEKVSREGLPALTAEERDFLSRASDVFKKN